MENTTILFGLRLPLELHAILKSLAERELRSMNSEIIVLINEALRVRNECDSERNSDTDSAKI